MQDGPTTEEITRGSTDPGRRHPDQPARRPGRLPSVRTAAAQLAPMPVPPARDVYEHAGPSRARRRLPLQLPETATQDSDSARRLRPRRARRRRPRRRGRSRRPGTTTISTTTTSTTTSTTRTTFDADHQGMAAVIGVAVSAQHGLVEHSRVAQLAVGCKIRLPAAALVSLLAVHRQPHPDRPGEDPQAEDLQAPRALCWSGSW